MVKIIHIEIPKDERSKDRISEIVEFFEKKVNDATMSQIDGVNCRWLVVRLRDGDYRKVIQGLESDVKVGVEFGAIDTYRLESTRPSVSSGKAFTRDFEPSIPIDALKEQVWNDASLSLTFILYVVVASIIAGFGLATNNAVAIVASMLVAPLMGPILCIIIGILVRDCKMIFTGLLSEAVGIFLSFVSGIVIGLFFTPFVDPNCALEAESVYCWPNFEMRTRGEWQGLITGLVIAIASGIGANLGIAHSNIASLAGTAISAALLPPIVNSGMMFVYAALGSVINIKGMDSEKVGDAFIVSGISLSLFIMNFFSILGSGLCILCLKRVAPLKKIGKDYKNVDELEVKDEENIKEISKNVQRSMTFPPAAVSVDNILVSEVNQTVDLADDEEYL